jgi:hypothetical protein
MRHEWKRLRVTGQGNLEDLDVCGSIKIVIETGGEYGSDSSGLGKRIGAHHANIVINVHLLYSDLISVIR